MRPRLPTGRALPSLLVACAYVLALVQRPGTLVADTKVHLYVDPTRFLSDVASAWTPTGDLGHVWAGQYGGYLWPMAPWFAAGHALGLAPWLVHRLWLGTLFAVAAVGMVKLLDALVTRRRSVLHVVAPVLYVLNPYVAVYANRTSIALLAYAALPWMLLAVHRGLREPTGWRWPAAFALVLATTGGGVNAAVTAWVLLGPVLFALYEVTVGGAGWRALRPWLARMVVLDAVLSAWWVVPTLVHARYGLNFLPYTEQPGTIWGVTSIPESLRLMGFWTSYIGVGYGGTLRPFASHGPSLLFNSGVVVASLAVPALALGSFAWVRRQRYAPFFLGLALVAVLVMSAGFPEGTPLRRGLTFTYNHVASVQVLRTTYKAGPLLALSVAVLSGLGAAAGLAWLRARPRGGLLGALALAVLAVLAAVAAWPLTSGRAPERQLTFAVPAAWRQAARQVEASGATSRALVEPGQLFASYDWGQTIDPILPTLTKHPVATRSIVPYADLRSVELQWTVDDLVSQERAVPGQLRPLLDLMGVGDVLLAADGDRTRSGELGAAEAAAVLRGQGLRFAPLGGARRRVPAAPRRLGPAAVLPEVGAARTATGGILRTVPRGPLTVLDGGAGALLGLAAFGALQPSTPLADTPDVPARELPAAGRAVIADGNRRQAFVASRLRGNRGPVLRADQDVSSDGTMLDPFAPTTGPRDPDRQTVSVLEGDLEAVSAPASPQVTQFPEDRPFAAVDGNPATAWIADRFLTPDRHVLTLRFRRPRDVPALTLTPYDDSRAVVRSVVVNGRGFRVGRGPTRLAVGLRGVRELRIALGVVTGSRTRSAGAGGIREVAIPGVRAREALRPPVTLEHALAGRVGDRTALTYLFDRVTADAPFDQGRYAGERGAGLLRDAQDPERELLRTIRPPATRSWRASAWVRTAPGTPDPVLDRLAGTRGALVATSASRFGGLPRHRASGAFDGSTARAWIGQWIPGRPAWLAWRAPRATSLSGFTLTPPTVRVRRPTRVRLVVDGRPGPALRVGAGGRVALPAAVRGRRFRLDVLAAAFPPGTPAAERQRRAVGVGELRAPGLPRLRVPRRGTVALPCGTAAVLAGPPLDVPGRTRRVDLRVTADRAALDAGRPLRATACGPALALPAARVDLAGAPAALRVDQLRLEAAPPRPVPAAAAATRAVTPGRAGNGVRQDASVAPGAPAWVVLGESWSAGWHATCDGRDLGASRPLQGFANAWPVPGRGCRDLDLAFRPNRVLAPAYLVSLLGALALLAALALGALRARRRGVVRAPEEEPALLPAREPARLGLRPALALGVLAALGLGFVFALRAGVVLGPLVALVLWRGIDARRLTLAATGLLLVVVPLLYVLFPGDDRGGFSTTYATDHLGAHWVAVGAVVLLGLAVVRTLSTARGRRGAPGAARPAAAPRA